MKTVGFLICCALLSMAACSPLQYASLPPHIAEINVEKGYVIYAFPYKYHRGRTKYIMMEIEDVNDLKYGR